METTLLQESTYYREALNLLDIDIIVFDNSLKTLFFSQTKHNSPHPNFKTLSDKIDNLSIERIKQLLPQSEEKPVETNITDIERTTHFARIKRLNNGNYLMVICKEHSPYFKKLEQNKIDTLASIAVMFMGLAHELKNPLAGIKLIAESLMSETENKEIKTGLLKIDKHVGRVNRIIKAFFSYARPSSDNKQVISVQEVIDEAVSIVSPKAENLGIAIKIDSGQNIPPVYGDKTKLSQAMVNLLLNAVESFKNIEREEKKIEISVKKTDYLPSSPVCQCKKLFDENIKRCGVVVSVSDNGEGIKEEAAKHIFDPFFTTKARGIGLGLALVKKFVEENCGELKFQSVYGSGSRFSVVLLGLERE